MRVERNDLERKAAIHLLVDVCIILVLVPVLIRLGWS